MEFSASSVENFSTGMNAYAIILFSVSFCCLMIMVSTWKRSVSLPATFIYSTSSQAIEGVDPTSDDLIMQIDDPHAGCPQAAPPLPQDSSMCLAAANEERLPTLAPAPSIDVSQDGVAVATDHDAIEERNMNNHPKLIESSLNIAAQAAVTLLTFWFSNSSKPLSCNAKILLDFAAGSNVVGYIFSFSSMLMWGTNKKLAKRILTVIAYAGGAFGFLAVIGMVLPDNLKLWVTAVACAACVPALAAAAKR